MAQRPLIAQQARDCAPTVALTLRARLVELGLRGLTAIEPTPGITPRQSGGNLLHRLLGVHRLIEEPLCLAPRPPSHPRDPAWSTPLSLVPFHLGLGLTRRVELPLGAFPLPLYDACEVASGVKPVQAHRYGLAGDSLGSLALHASGCMRQLPPARKPLASLGDDVLQARPVGDDLAPTLPAAIRTPVARHPRHAGGGDRHQHRLAMQKDFI
jgi:hypothetical protein